MNARWALALAAVLVGVIVFVSSRRHYGAMTAGSDARASSANAHPDDPLPRAPAPPKLSPAPSRDLIGQDPERAARSWQARVEQVVFAKNRKDYGDEIAHLMQLPFEQAWPALLQRAKDGDARAAMAAVSVEAICQAQPVSSHRNADLPPASSYYIGLPDAWKPFVDRISELHRNTREQMISLCELDDAFDFASVYNEVFLKPGNPDGEIAIAESNNDRSEAIAELRALIEHQEGTRGRFRLANLLVESQDAAEAAEGRTLLEHLAPDDPAAAARLGFCLEAGCGGSAPDPAAARPWLEQAAGLGDHAGLSTLTSALEHGGDNAGAWAWSLYTLDLALAGCFETLYPSYHAIAMAAQEEARIKALLTPAEQNAGLAMNYAISGRWERQAKERLSCD